MTDFRKALGSNPDSFDDFDSRPERRETGVKTPAYLLALLKGRGKKPASKKPA